MTGRNDSNSGVALLATKLYVPPPRRNVVARPRLRDLLAGTGGGAVTLVSAPAGSGKSTLLADWALHEERQIAWLSLDEDDDDPIRLLGGIVAALRHCGAIGEEILFDQAQAIAPQTRELVLVELLNSLTTRGRPVALVLDDYHVVRSQAAHEVVQFMADRLPPLLHLVIASRVDPSLALSRLRARNLLLELRADDLRFTASEASEFFGQAMGVSLAPEQVAELERRTEGWAAGLQLAALSLKGRGAPEQFIRGFSGSNRYVLDYLTEEVLARQPDDVRRFLLETSLLARLSAPLCDAVTGRGDSGDVLRRLEAANMFLIPLDDVRFWYRYHHLFATVLRHQLERTALGAEIAELHRRAGAWYASNGMPGEALQHSLLAGDVDRAVELVSRHALARVLEGQPATVVRWIDQLPRERVEHDLDLLLVQAVALIAEFQRDRALVAATRAGTLITPETPSFDVGRWLTVSGTVARSAAVRFALDDEGNVRTAGDDEARARVELARAIELLPHDSFWSGMASLNYGLSLVAGVHLLEADRVFERVRPLHRRPDTLMMALLAQTYSAQCRLWLGRPDEAAQLGEESLAWIEELGSRGERLPLGAFPHAILADVHTEWHDLERARELASRALEYGRSGFSVAFYEASGVMARFAEAAGEWDLALQSLADMQRMIVPAWRRGMEALTHRILLRRGIATGSASDVAAAGAWIAREGFDRFRERWPEALAPAFYADSGFVTAARWLIEKGRLDEARDLLGILLPFARSRQRILTIVDLLVLRSLVESRGGDEAAAVATMVEALTLASAPRFVSVFAREGAAVQPIVQRAAPRVADTAFAGRVLSSLELPPTLASPAVGILESLSERELEVLTLLATGASNQEIGRKLFISAATVKKHLENIYGKLGVGGRGQAVARARELRIL